MSGCFAIDEINVPSGTRGRGPRPLNHCLRRVRSRSVFAAVRKHLSCVFADGLRQIRQPFPDGSRRSGGGLLDVERPVLVHDVRDIDAQPCQFVLLFLGPRSAATEPEPVPGNNDPVVSVDVEALLSDPPLRSAPGLSTALR